MKKVGRSTGRLDVWQREISKENGYSEFSVMLDTKRSRKRFLSLDQTARSSWKDSAGGWGC